MFKLVTDSSIKYQGSIPENTYHKFCKNYYSQNGEDGILEQLLKELNIETGYCCEFGASDGVTSSNTYKLIKDKNFSSIQIESNPHLFEKLLSTHYNNSNVKCYNQYVNSSDILTKLLKINNYPKFFDVLSIDIDSIDYEIWKDFIEYEPKIVIIEANSYRDPIVEEIHQQPTKDYFDDPLLKWYPGRVALGASFYSIIKLGLNKNYTPISFTGNVTFIHNNYINDLKIFPYVISKNPDDYLYLYTNLCMCNDEWFTNSALIFNTSIRNYYINNKSKKLNYEWIFKEMQQKNQNIWEL